MVSQNNTGFSSGGRAFDCSGKQTSNSRWFESGNPDNASSGSNRSYSEIVSRLTLPSEIIGVEPIADTYAHMQVWFIFKQ